MINFLLSLLFILTSCSSFAFVCKSPEGVIKAGGGTANVRVTINPVLSDGENIIIDLTKPASLIQCWNPSAPSWTDTFWPISGTAFGDSTKINGGTLHWFNYTRSLPVNSEASWAPITLSNTNPITLNVKFTLRPHKGIADGIIIKKNTTIGIFKYEQTNNHGEKNFYTWNIIANNDVIIPRGTCVANSYDPNVTLNNYDPNKSSQKPINLSIHCAEQTNLSYSLDGVLASNEDQSVFKNTAKNGAKGIGIRFFNNGKIINKYESQNMGIVDNSYKSLNLSADYGIVKGVPLSAGDVSSQATVNITYS